MTGPQEQTRCYTVLDIEDGGEPAGLVRRRFVDPGPLDEALQRDLSWRWTPGLIRWERYGELDSDFVEISEDEAMALIERFRAKWSAEDAQS